MKTYWSAFFPLLLLSLVGCGSEQFGTASKSTSTQADGLKSFQQLSCSTYTLIKPKVDILYVVDNSLSNTYIESGIRSAVSETVNSISKEFDYRVIGTNLLPDSTPYNDYQVLTNSSDILPSEAAGKKVISASELNFFELPADETIMETGLSRVVNFINNKPGLFRTNAYLLIVLVSNGRDEEVQYSTSPTGNGSAQNATLYNQRLASFTSIKSSLNLQQLRFMSVTPDRGCTRDGWRDAETSYNQMSRDLYQASGAKDNGSARDHYNLCGSTSISSIFASVNNSIKQVVVPHVYKYWPITFAENNETVSLSEIQVYKVTGNNAPVLLPSSSWTYRNIPGGVNTRVSPTPGEFNSGSHFVEFNSSSYITYPDCVQVKSVSRTEYFGFVVIPQEPVASSIVVRVNGKDIPNSSTNGWSYLGNVSVPRNIKMPYPASGDELPAVYKTGFMVQLNGSANYYKSGDSVEVFYTPQAI